MEENIGRMDQYKEILREDAEAIQTYIDELYSVRVPPPPKPTASDMSFWKLAGIEATLFSIAALGGAVLSAVRTGGLFYILEEKLLMKFQLTGLVADSLSLVALVTALLAFEGFLIAYGFAKGKANKQVKISRVGLAAAFIVIICAGIFSGFGIITLPPNWEQIFDIILALVTAVSAGVVTYFGGENIGYSVSKVTDDRQAITEQYQIVYNKWIQRAVDSYKQSHYSLNKMGVQLSSKNEREMNEGVQSQVQSAQKMKKSEQARLEVVQFERRNGRLPSVSELAEHSRISGGLSRGLAHYAITDCIYENAEEYMEKGYIDQERFKSVKDSVEARYGSQE